MLYDVSATAGVSDAAAAVNDVDVVDAVSSTIHHPDLPSSTPAKSSIRDGVSRD